MKKIFIYYSLTGNGDKVAEYLNNKGMDIIKVETKEKLPNNTFLRIMTGGFKALINYQDKLDNFDSNIDNYDEVIIGSPIWNSRLCSPINSVLKELDLSNKKVSFILYSGSGKNNKAVDTIKNKYPESMIINLKEPKNNEFIEYLKGL